MRAKWIKLYRNGGDWELIVRSDWIRPHLRLLFLRTSINTLHSLTRFPRDIIFPLMCFADIDALASLKERR